MTQNNSFAVHMDMTTGRPRIALASLPTPLERAPRLAAHLGLGALYVKREDMAGYALGGNKLRQLDFILAEAIAAGADMVVARPEASPISAARWRGRPPSSAWMPSASARQDGHGKGRQSAARPDFRRRGQLYHQHRSLGPRDRGGTRRPSRSATRQAGRNPYVVQLTGTSANTGVAGWVSGAAELRRTISESRCGIPDGVVVVCGSGLTLAGLALGFKHLGCPARLIGISAQQPAARLSAGSSRRRTRRRSGWASETRLDADDFDIIDSEIGPGYGMPSEASIVAVQLAGRTRDWCSTRSIPAREWRRSAPASARRAGSARALVVFLHSGGTPGLFTHAAAFQVEVA